MQTIVDTGAGADSLLINQLYTVAAGGDFWESGGALTASGSSTDITLSVSSVTVNIGGETVTHGSQPVTHSPTAGEYRSDVIYADSSGVSVLEGVEMAKIPTGNQFPSVWQPAPDNGSLVPGVPLWVVHITPEDAASTDIESWQFQNRRMNSQTFSPAEVVALLEGFDTDANGPITTTVTNSEALGGRSVERVYGTLSPVMVSADLNTNISKSHIIETDANEVVHLHRIGSTSRGGVPVDTRAQVVDYHADGTETIEFSSDAVNEAVDVTFPPDTRYGLRIKNKAVDTLYCTGSFWITID